MDMPIRIEKSFFYFKLNVIVEIRLLAKFDYRLLSSIIHGSFSSAKSEKKYVPNMSAACPCCKQRYHLYFTFEGIPPIKGHCRSVCR